MTYPQMLAKKDGIMVTSLILALVGNLEKFFLYQIFCKSVKNKYKINLW
jgi:hypothetical protein